MLPVNVSYGIHLHALECPPLACLPPMNEDGPRIHRLDPSRPFVTGGFVAVKMELP